MNKAKAMLDALMGPGRDLAAKDRTIDDFDKAAVCKHYLIGYCPNALLGKKLNAIHLDPGSLGICPGSIYKTTVIALEGCTLEHNKGFKNQLSQHPESAKYIKRYERDLQRFLGRIIREADNKVADEKRKRDASGKPDENEHCWIKLCDTCGMTYKLAKKKPQTDSARRGMWALGDQTLMPGDWYCPACKEINFATQDKCLNCQHDRPPESKVELDKFQADVEDRHPEIEVCKGYANLRQKLAELTEKYKDDDDKDEKDKGRDGRNRSRSRGGRRERRDDSGRDGGKSRRDDGDRDGGRRGDRGRSDEGRGGDRKNGRAAHGRGSPSPLRRRSPADGDRRDRRGERRDSPSNRRGERRRYEDDDYDNRSDRRRRHRD